ncbi:MAG: dihydroorotate dehydrogenase (quinone), partial [Pseudomonadota bacterium]
PNTPGLRNLQAGEALQVLIDRVFEQVAIAEEKHGRQVPVFLKIAPDLETGEMDEIAGIVSASKLSALIVSNTTLARDGLKNRIYANEAGGLSGQPLFESSTRVVAQMRKRLDPKIPIIGVGGIGNAQQAITKICAGASLVQLYTGMVYEGPCLPSQIVMGMSKYLDETGVASVSELVGTKTEEWL